jgi:hypothetical protein
MLKWDLFGDNLGKVGDFFGYNKQVYVLGGLDWLIDIFENC